MAKSLIATLDSLWELHNRSRARFPYLTNQIIGQTVIETAELYKALGLDVKIDYKRPIASDDIAKDNEISGWLNENFLTRLCSVLEDFEVFPKKKKQRQQWMRMQTGDGEYVVLLIRLRNYFIHELGRYDSNNDEHDESVALLQRLLGVPMSDRTTWDTSIDKVLRPLFDACRRFAASTLTNG